MRHSHVTDGVSLEEALSVYDVSLHDEPSIDTNDFPGALDIRIAKDDFCWLPMMKPTSDVDAHWKMASLFASSARKLVSGTGMARSGVRRGGYRKNRRRDHRPSGWLNKH